MDTKKAKEIIAKFTKTDINNLKLEFDFKNDLHIDSIDLLQMVMEIEDAYNIKIDNNELLNIKTVGDALNKLENAK